METSSAEVAPALMDDDRIADASVAAVDNQFAVAV
jgi:hypothetical protein